MPTASVCSSRSSSRGGWSRPPPSPDPSSTPTHRAGRRRGTAPGRRRLHPARLRPPHDPRRRLAHDRPRPDRRAPPPAPGREAPGRPRPAGRRRQGHPPDAPGRLPVAARRPGGGGRGPHPAGRPRQPPPPAAGGRRLRRRSTGSTCRRSAPPTCPSSSSTPTPCPTPTTRCRCAPPPSPAPTGARPTVPTGTGPTSSAPTASGPPARWSSAGPTPTTAATVLPGVERSINVLAVGAAGVSKKADEVDATSTARIVEAVRKAVAAGAFHPLASWSDLKSVAVLPARVLVLITHTIEGAAGDVLGTKLQLGADDLSLHRIGRPYVNPADLEPGPVVLAIGCDTGELEASFSRLRGAPVRCRGRAGGVGHLAGAGEERGRLRRPLLRRPPRLPGHPRHPPLRRGPHRGPAADGGRRRRARPRPHRHRRRRRRPGGSPDRPWSPSNCSPPATATPSSSPTAPPAKSPTAS